MSFIFQVLIECEEILLGCSLWASIDMVSSVRFLEVSNHGDYLGLTGVRDT